MKRLLAIIFAFCAGSALALQEPQDCSLPAGSPGNFGFSPPITTQIGSYTCGPTQTGVGASPAGACNNYALINGSNPDSYLTSCSSGGSSGQCYWNDGGSASWIGPLSSNGCPTGYTLTGGNCKSEVAIAEDAAAVIRGNTLARNADGVVTDRLDADGDHWHVNTFDSLGRASDITMPNGSHMLLTWYPYDILPYKMTVGDSSVIYVWNERGTPDFIQSPEGNIYAFEYGGDSDHPTLKNIRVQTAVKDCGSARSGSPISCNVPVGPDPQCRGFITSNGVHQINIVMRSDTGTPCPGPFLGGVPVWPFAAGVAALVLNSCPGRPLFMVRGAGWKGTTTDVAENIKDTCKAVQEGDRERCENSTWQHPGSRPTAPLSEVLDLRTKAVACMDSMNKRRAECDKGGPTLITTPLKTF